METEYEAMGIFGEIERVASTVDMYDRPESVASDLELAIGAARARSGRWRGLVRPPGEGGGSR